MRGPSLAMKGVVLLMAVFVVFKFGAPLITAPLPMSLIWLYLFLTTVGIVVYGTLSGESTEALLGPIFRFLSGEGLNGADRKSTRLNSSHGYISYAVFCLKKKKQNKRYDCLATRS